jgi:hypothetical protein
VRNPRRFPRACSPEAPCDKKSLSHEDKTKVKGDACARLLMPG